MYDGYQVLRVENNYKSKDLFLIGNEMKNRIGTGNYDSERTKFNITFKGLEKENLYQDVKYKLESRNIVQIIEVQNTKLLESKQKELPEPKEKVIDYEDAEYYDYDEKLDNKKEDDLVL